MQYLQGGMDNSFFVWQWISLGLMTGQKLSLPAPLRANFLTAKMGAYN